MALIKGCVCTAASVQDESASHPHLAVSDIVYVSLISGRC